MRQGALKIELVEQGVSSRREEDLPRHIWTIDEPLIEWPVKEEGESPVGQFFRKARKYFMAKPTNAVELSREQ